VVCYPEQVSASAGAEGKMIKIRNVRDRPVIINYMTLSPGEEMPVIDENLLDSADVKALLAKGDIEVIPGDGQET
jgi:hypothetical protein